jgi:hypothetical protein
LIPTLTHHTREVTMAQSTAPTTPHPLLSRRDQLRQDPGLPFLELLSRALVEDMCRQLNHPWRNRTYTPWITLGLFLSCIGILFMVALICLQCNYVHYARR